MTEKELQKLKRVELVELLLRQVEENQRLKDRIYDLEDELNEAKDKLDDRQIILRKAGSIAKASLELNGVFEAAQKAADDYLNSIMAIYNDQKDKAEKADATYKRRGEQLLQETQERCRQMEEETRRKCNRMLREAGR
jgi:hypothetical protein